MKKSRYPKLVTEKDKIRIQEFIAKRRSPLELKWRAQNGGKPIKVNRENG